MNYIQWLDQQHTEALEKRRPGDMKLFVYRKLCFGGLAVVAGTVEHAKEVALAYLDRRASEVKSYSPADYAYDFNVIANHDPDLEGPAPIVYEVGEES